MTFKASRYQSRIRASFRKVFETPAGQDVIAYLYERCHGNQSTFPQSGNSHELAFNEGKRMAYLMIMDQLREEDSDVRKAYRLHTDEKLREEMQE